MASPIQSILFLCTGNSARSILAEALLDRLGEGRFRAYSAGSHPSGRVHPMALALLQERGYSTSKLRSKSWDEFTRPGAPKLDLVITVCDRAAGEPCPLWLRAPLTAHWGIDDPAAFVGPAAAQRQLFRRVYLDLERHIERFCQLPFEALEHCALKERLNEMGSRSARTREGDESPCRP